MNWGEPASPTPGPPDGIQTRAEFALGLTALRARSGMTVRELARRLDTPSATIGDYVSGRHLPGPSQLDLFRALLRECGVAEPERALWVDAVTRLRATSDRRVGRAATPYRGLEPFRTEDAELFFGREQPTSEVLDRLRELGDQMACERDQLGMLLVVGPSGSGKSSLLRAGVQASVQSGALDSGGVPWSTAVITPGTATLEALHRGVAELDGGIRLLIIDQFEEVFALPNEERQEVFAGLRHLCSLGTLVVAGLRADFYEAAVREPQLLPLLRTRQILLGPMTAEEVRRSILEPAAVAGVHVEEGLVDLLLADLAPGSPTGFAHDAGALPLLSHALLATWQRAPHNQLTITDYRAAGGLRGAVSQSAEELYASLTEPQQELARRIFCRLVKVEDGAPLTRRRVPRDQLQEFDSATASGQDGEAPDRAPAAVLDRFVSARLVTVDAETVQLSHEALLTAWPRLAEWVDRDRSDLRLHDQLTEAANQWVSGERDPSLLLRGTRLAVLAGWADEAAHRQELNRTEREYLDAGVALAEAERRAARQHTRRTQQLLGATALLAVAAVVLAIVAFHAQHTADLARDQALSRQVAIEAGDLAPSDPSLAMQLAVAAYRISPTEQATSQLLGTSADEMPTRLLGPTGPTTVALSDSGDEFAVAYANTDQIKVFALAGAVPRLMSTVSAGQAPGEVYAVALSPNGRLLVAGGTGKQIMLWSLARVAHPSRLTSLGGFSGTIYGLSFNSDGRTLAAAVSDGTVRRWSLTDSAHPLAQPTLVAPGHPALQALSYRPGGRQLTAVGADGKLVVWDTAGRSRPLITLTVAPTILTSVVYSRDGKTLAAGGQNALAYVWKLRATGAPQAQRTLHGFSSWVDSLAFSHEGRYLAAGDSDQSIRVWSTADWRVLAKLRQPAPVTGIGFGPGDQSLVTADEDGTARVWQFPPQTTYRAPGSLYTIDYTADGHEMAAVSGGPAGDVSLWNTADPWRPTPLASVTMPSSFGPVAGVGALSPDGKLLVVGNAQAKARLVDLADPARPRLVGGVLGGAVPNIEQLNFSPDMKVLSVGDDAGRIHLWDISDPSHPTALPTLDQSGASSNVFGVAYSPNGKLLAAAAADHKVWLWDIADPLHPRRLAILGGFTSYTYTVAFTPSGRTLIAGSADDTVRLWNLSDPARPRLLERLTGPTSTVYQVNVSPDGSTLAASTTGQQVWLWSIRNPARPRVLAELPTDGGEVFDVNFSPDGRTLVAGGTDQTLQFWNYHPAQVAGRICSLAGSPISRAEWAQYVQGAKYDPPCR